MSNGLGDILELVGGYLKQIWLKRRYIVIIPWLLAPVGWYAVLQMPDEYRTSAKLYIDTDSMIRPLLRGLTVENNSAHQMSLMIQTLLSRPNVEKIARLADLDLHTHTETEFSDLVTELQKTIGLSSPERQRNMYTISYRHEDARISKQVVESTITVLTENSLGKARNDSENAREFLERQIREYAVRLRQMQSEQSGFQREHAAVLALSSEGYVRELQRLREQLAQEQQRLKEIQARLESARLQLMDEIDNPSPFYAAPQLAGSQPFSDQYSTVYDTRIAALQSEQDRLLLRFTTSHPDVKEIARRIGELEQKRSEAISELQRQSSNSDDSESSGQESSASPLFQVAKMSVNELEKEQASLLARISSLSETLHQVDANFARFPELNNSLGAMERNYTITFQKYNELLERQETAQFSEEVDTGTETFKIRLIEPPQLPKKPSYPPRGPYLSGVTLLTILAGAALSLLISQLNPAVVSGHELSRSTGIPLLGSVSLGETASEQQQGKKNSRLFWLTSSCFVLLFSCLLVLEMKYQLHTRVPGVDVALADINTRFGELLSMVKTHLR